jgi:hypothetical protein
MSNYLAVATVTAAIAQILLNAFHTTRPAISGATVTTGKPESVKANPSFVGANLYLYQISPNIAYRNSDLATRNSNGRLLQRPQVALDLNYLITFYGGENSLESQLLLGCTLSALHAQPVLTSAVINEAIKHSKGTLAQSDLAAQIESVKVAPLYLSLEEWSKLWTVFFQATHVLSVCYQSSVVLIDADLPAPAPALPVRGASVRSTASLQPFVAEVAAQGGGAGTPIVPGTTLLVTGQRMRGQTTRALVGGDELPVESVAPDGTSLTVALPRRVVRAGTLDFQVVSQTAAGSSGVPVAVESNVVTFKLCPAITRMKVMSEAESLLIYTDPIIGATQQVSVMLNEVSGASPASYKLWVGSRAGDSNHVSVSLAGIQPGTYLARISVDGAESPLEVDTKPKSPTFNRYVRPQVVIP